MATWQKLVALTFIGAVVVSACEFNSGDDDNDDFWNDDDSSFAGSGNRAGQATAGRAGAGAGGVAGSGTGGRAGSGGAPTAGSGGSGNTAGMDDGIPDDLTCGEGQGADPWDGSCSFEDGFDARYSSCLSCLGTSCCGELRQCYATNPSTSCGYGGVDGQPEYLCFIECLVTTIDENGFYDDEDEGRCAFECGTARDGQGRACETVLIANSTNELLSCMHTNCEADCVEDLVGAP